MPQSDKKLKPHDVSNNTFIQTQAGSFWDAEWDAGFESMGFLLCIENWLIQVGSYDCAIDYTDGKEGTAESLWRLKGRPSVKTLTTDLGLTLQALHYIPKITAHPP